MAPPSAIEIPSALYWPEHYHYRCESKKFTDAAITAAEKRVQWLQKQVVLIRAQEAELQQRFASSKSPSCMEHSPVAAEALVEDLGIEIRVTESRIEGLKAVNKKEEEGLQRMGKITRLREAQAKARKDMKDAEEKKKVAEEEIRVTREILATIECEIAELLADEK